MKKTNVLKTTTLLASGMLLLAACSQGTSSETTSSQAADAVAGSSASPADSAGTGSLPDVELAKSEVAKYEGVPTDWTVPASAVPFDASALAGKKIYYVGVGTQYELQKLMIPILEDAFAKNDVVMDVFENQGTPAEWAKGVEQAVNQGYDAILLMGNSPQYFAPAVTLANEAGIPVIPTWVRAPSTPPTEGLDLFGAVYNVDELQGKLEADWVIADADGKPVHAIVLGASDQGQNDAWVKSITDEFETVCGPTCKVTVIDVPAAQWAQKTQSEVQSALVANPDVNYVIPFATAQQSFVVPGIQAADKVGQVKSVSGQGVPFGLDMIRDGDVVAADVGQDLSCMANMAVDNTMRAVAGLEPSENIDPATGWGTLPVRVWTKANVADAGVPAEFFKGYGDACTAAYEKIWANQPAS